MKEQNTKRSSSTANIVQLPGFSWSGRQAFSELRMTINREQQRSLTYDELGAVMGIPRTTTYRWIEELEHESILGLFACLERLPTTDRQHFVDSHCRIFPGFAHPALAHSPAQVGKLIELLQKPRGLTIISGGRDFARKFVFNAFGHTCHQLHSKRWPLTGLDLNPPGRLVPLEFCTYVQGRGLDGIRQAVLRIWSKIVTTSARIVMLNGLWLLEDLRQDILRLAGRAHVVLACSGTPDLNHIRRQLSSPIHLVVVFDSKVVPGGIRMNCRQLKHAKSVQKGAKR